MHDLLFERAQEWSGEEGAASIFKQYAAEIGLDTDAFATCLDSGATASEVQAQLDMGLATGVPSVPYFLINEWAVSGAQPFEVFQEVIEAALRGERPPPTPTPLPPGVSMFDVNPEQPGYTYTGDVTFGPAEAKVVLLEFLDFSSAANAEFYEGTWRTLYADYVLAGKVRMVIKHLPASSEQPLKAAEAAECAAQQGAFLTMHDLLFQEQASWSQSAEIVTVLKGYASQLGLDAAAFATCVESGATVEKISQDVAIAQNNGLPAAPQFVVLQGVQGSIIPLEDLQQAIDELLTQ
jgi:protein-disulfide isomerase